MVHTRQNGAVTSNSGRRKVYTKERLLLQVEHNDLLSVPPLTQEETQKLYDLFIARYKPWEITSQFGFNPAAVEIEYRRFLREQELDRDYSRSALLDAITLVPDNTLLEIEQLVNEYKKTGNLTDEEARLLLGYINYEQRHIGEQDLITKISDSTKGLPDKLTGLHCAICGIRIAGIALVKGSTIEKYLRGEGISCIHHNQS